MRAGESLETRSEPARSTEAEQTTFPELPPELIVSIARAAKDGVVLVKMLRMCKATRARR